MDNKLFIKEEYEYKGYIIQVRHSGYPEYSYKVEALNNEGNLTKLAVGNHIDVLKEEVENYICNMLMKY